MYALAIIGLLTTVMSAFYYLKIIKTIYFDDSLVTFDLKQEIELLKFLYLLAVQF